MTKTKYTPKYWSTKRKSVIEGVVTRNIPTQLGDILGTYVWVFSGDPEFGGNVEEMYYNSKEGDATFIKNQSITLDAMKDIPEKMLLPKAISGCINWGTLKLTYDGLRRVREKWSTDESVDWQESYWEVLLANEGRTSTGEEWLNPEGNAIGITAIDDDNGNPFLRFDWQHPSGGHSSWSGYYLGKKVVKGKPWRLTGEEESRLGIGYTFRKVEKIATGECNNEYVEDEDDSEGDSSSDDGDSGDEDDSGEDNSSDGDDSDKEDTGSGDEGNEEGGDESASQIKAAGGKRKGSEGGTSAVKRRRT